MLAVCSPCAQVGMGCAGCKQVKYEDGEEVMYKDKPAKVVSSVQCQYGWMYTLELEDGTKTSPSNTVPHSSIKKKGGAPDDSAAAA